MWLPFVLALALAGTFIWRIVERLHQAKSDAHSAREAATQAKLSLLETQLADLKRSASQSQVASLSRPRLDIDIKATESSTIPNTSHEEKVYVSDSVTPQFLLAQKAGQTNYQGAVRIEPYIGK